MGEATTTRVANNGPLRLIVDIAVLIILGLGAYQVRATQQLETRIAVLESQFVHLPAKANSEAINLLKDRVLRLEQQHRK